MSPSIPASSLAATLNAQGSLPPPTPITPYQPMPSAVPVHTAGAHVISQAPPASGGTRIAIALFAGFVVLGLMLVVASGGIAYFLRTTPAPPKRAAAAGAPVGGGAEAPADTPADEAPSPPTEFGARSGKGFDGIGATTIEKRIAATGWKLASDPIKNIEGTFTSSAMELSRGSEKATVTIYRFDDDEEAKKTESILRQKRGAAVERQSAAILEVLVPQNETEAKRLLDLIKGTG